MTQIRIFSFPGGEIQPELKMILETDETIASSDESLALQLLSSYRNESDSEDASRSQGNTST